jgi:hypothetical protein
LYNKVLYLILAINKEQTMVSNNGIIKSLIAPAAVTAILLLIPLIAMQFTQEVNWDLFDFIVAGFLLFSTGAVYKLVTRKKGNIIYKLAMAVALASGLFLVWANLAVGIIGSENNPINIIYFAVVLAAIIVSVIIRFRAASMAYLMFSMTAAFVIIPVTLLFSKGMFSDEFPTNAYGLFVIHGFFGIQFIISALLFYRADQEKKRI